MTPTEITQLAGHFDKNLRPWIEDLIKREIDHRIHAMKMHILTDLSEETIRKLIRDTVTQHIAVTVAVK